MPLQEPQVADADVAVRRALTVILLSVVILGGNAVLGRLGVVVSPWKTSLVSPGTPGSPPLHSSLENKFAYVTFVSNPAHKSRRRLAKGGAVNTVNNALQAVCTLNRTGVRHPIVVLASNFDASVHQLFLKAGASLVIDPQWDPRPHFRMQGAPAQQRSDAVFTYYKLIVFNLTAYTRLLFFDSDVLWFDEPPDYVFDHPNASALEFVGLWESRSKYFSAYGAGSNWERGINSHLMLLRPNTQRFQNILYRAKTGNFRPFTNGDQDVIEAEYAPTAGFFFTGNRHIHGAPPELGGVAGGVAAGLLEDLRDNSNKVGVLRMPHHWHYIGPPLQWEWAHTKCAPELLS